MDLLCKQIGLNIEGEHREVAYGTTSQILLRLRGYTDNGPILIFGPGRLPPEIDQEGDSEYKIFLAVLDILATHNIINYKLKNPNYRGSRTDVSKEFSVIVTNRYKLERLRAELKWIGEPESNRSGAPQVDNLVYYNPLSGHGFVNGNKVRLKGRNRKLFKALSDTAPDPVLRKNLEGIARLGHKDDDLKYAMNDAFSALRKACKVNKSVIYLRDDGGRLDANVFPPPKLPKK